MTRKEFEETLTDICNVDLSKIKGIHPSMDHCTETFYIKGDKYHFEITNDVFRFDVGIDTPVVAMEEKVTKDYFRSFYAAVDEILQQVNGSDYIASLIDDTSKIGEEDTEDAMASAFFFKILLNFSLNHLANSVVERCM